MNTLKKELVGPCWVCGKMWKREDTDGYFYFNDMLVCVCHDGAKEWYNGAFRLVDEKLRFVQF
jgi:hypothetical protein